MLRPTQIIVLYIITAVYSQEDNIDYGEPLYLTPLIQQGKIEEAKTLAQVHHEDFLNVTSYSGFFSVDEQHDSQMFFWYFPSQKSSDSPLILWLEGGPGMPASYEIFYGNGPFYIANDTIGKRDISWNEQYHMLYIDSPVGVGFSHTSDDYPPNETDVSNNLFSSLTQFLTMFPELQDNELYVVGESYGAKFTINLCDTIQRNNENASLFINLQGFALLSGYFDPIKQLDYSRHLYNIGLIDEHGYEKLNAKYKILKSLLGTTNTDDFLKILRPVKFFLDDWPIGTNTFQEFIIQQILDHPNFPVKSNYVAKRMAQNFYISNILLNEIGYKHFYNVLLPDKEYNFFDKYSKIDSCLESKREALHLGNATYHASISIYKFNFEHSKSEAITLANLLSHYRGVVATGQLDIIVAYPLLINVLNKLNFSSSQEWLKAKRQHWHIDDELAGYYKVAGNLTEVMVLNSGHFIPEDKPKSAYEIVNKLTSNTW